MNEPNTDYEEHEGEYFEPDYNNPEIYSDTGTGGTDLGTGWELFNFDGDW